MNESQERGEPSKMNNFIDAKQHQQVKLANEKNANIATCAAAAAAVANAAAAAAATSNVNSNAAAAAVNSAAAAAASNTQKVKKTYV